MIQVDNLTKTYGPIIAVDRVHFSVDRGEVVGFLGPNGAGKTTTMRMLTTFLPATSGIATIAGFDVMNQSTEVRRNIGYLPESVPLYPEMRVEEYVLYRAKLKGLDRRDRQKRVDYCLDRCRVREVRRRLIGTLSKGYRQRVGLADAMVHDPPILILDEPTVGLDPIQIRETLALIRELGERRTILLSTHILSEVEAICQRVIIIAAGRVGLDRKLAELETARRDVVIEVSGPTDPVANVLRTTDGVAEVTITAQGSGHSTFEVRGQNHHDLREALSQRITKNGWVIRHLSTRGRRLEDHFFEVVAAADPRGTGRRPEGPDRYQAN